MHNHATFERNKINAGNDGPAGRTGIYILLYEKLLVRFAEIDLSDRICRATLQEEERTVRCIKL